MKRKAETLSKTEAKGSASSPGQATAAYPQGIETLLRRAASDPACREQLLQERAGAAAAIGLELDPAEKAMLESIPSAQLLLTIERLEAARERRRGFLVKLAIVTLMAAPAGGLWFWRRREPSYKDKSLKEWLRLGEQYGWAYPPMHLVGGAVFLVTSDRVPPKAEMAEVEAALHAMGPKAIPPMLAMLETRDPAWKVKLMKWLGKQSAGKIPFTKAQTYQKRALIGLTVLGPLATNAVPVIRKVMADANRINDVELHAYAREALEKITGTNIMR